jgi:hypothetical protein
MMYSKKFNHEPHEPHERREGFYAKVRDVRVKLSQAFRNNPGNQSMTYPYSCGSWLISLDRGFPKTSVFGKATLKFAVLQGCRKIKSLKNCKRLSQNRAR